MNDIPSNYDPTQWLEALESDKRMDTKVAILPHGARINFTVESYEVRRVTPEDQSKKPFTAIEFVCYAAGDQRLPTGETVAEMTGRDKAYARYKGFVDLTPEGWDWGKGKNVTVGALREAVGQNADGQNWKLAML